MNNKPNPDILSLQKQKKAIENKMAWVGGIGIFLPMLFLNYFQKTNFGIFLITIMSSSGAYCFLLHYKKYRPIIVKLKMLGVVVKEKSDTDYDDYVEHDDD